MAKNLTDNPYSQDIDFGISFTDTQFIHVKGHSFLLNEKTNIDCRGPVELGNKGSLGLSHQVVAMVTCRKVQNCSADVC